MVTGSPSSFAARIAGKLSVAGASERLYVDLVMQQDGRGMVETVYFGITAPPSSPLEARLAAISASRLARYAG